MIILAFIACLTICQKVEIPLTATPQQCTIMGQLAVIDWLREHPNYELSSGYTCEADGSDT
jgi:hypothetical protein